MLHNKNQNDESKKFGRSSLDRPSRPPHIIKNETMNEIPDKKPEAISFEEFQKINFLGNQGKPHIFDDFLVYVLGYDINKNYHRVNTLKFHERKSSEDILLDLYARGQDLSISYPNYPYLRSLEKAMRLFPPHQIRILLEKFELLKCSTFKHQKLISLSSLTGKWAEFFGYKSDYISHCFYNFLSGRKHKDISKPSFLKKCYSMKTKDLNKFAFKIYDKNLDGLLTCDEINNMMMALPANTSIYKECQILVNEFVSSIFGRRHKPLKGIDFSLFCDLLPKSLLTIEFLQSLLTPLSELPRKNKSFSVSFI